MTVGESLRVTELELPAGRLLFRRLHPSKRVASIANSTALLNEHDRIKSRANKTIEREGLKTERARRKDLDMHLHHDTLLSRHADLQCFSALRTNNRGCCPLAKVQERRGKNGEAKENQSADNPVYCCRHRRVDYVVSDRAG
jgi:hypothetical protein